VSTAIATQRTRQFETTRLDVHRSLSETIALCRKVDISEYLLSGLAMPLAKQNVSKSGCINRIVRNYNHCKQYGA